MGRLRKFILFFLVILAIYFSSNTIYILYREYDIKEKNIITYIDKVEERVNRFFLNLTWEETTENFSKTSPFIKDSSLIFFKTVNEKNYKIEIQNYYSLLSLLLKNIPTKDYNYAFFISEDTRYIYHPNRSLLPHTLFSEAEADNSYKLYKMAKKIFEDKPEKFIGKIDANKMTNQVSRIEYRKLKNFPLYLGVVSLSESLQLEIIKEVKNNIYSLIIVLTLILLISILDKKENRIKHIVVISFFQFLLLIFLIATINFSSGKEIISNFSPISSPLLVSKFLKNNRIIKEGEIFIRIKNIDFLSGDNIRISGLIEYPIDKFEKVFFPDATDYSESILKNKNNIITKNFDFSLAQNFLYHKYPLESNIVSIKITTWNDENSTVLTPNFSKYSDNLLISSKWGLDKDLGVNNWNILGTFFSFEEVEVGNYNLTFNIFLKRNILAPFISYLLPFFIIIGLLFSLILLLPKKKEDINMEFFIGSISGLFFTILLSQAGLRENVTAGEILYLDYFYFFLYLVLFFIITTIFFYKNSDLEFSVIQRIKLYFCYFTFLFLLVITFINFP